MCSLHVCTCVCVCTHVLACSLPLQHVTLRLEAIAAGLWPHSSDAATDNTLVVACLRRCIGPMAKDGTSAVVAGESAEHQGGGLHMDQ